MTTFSPTTITIAGLVLTLVEFATAGTELPHLLGETAYAVVAFVLGAIGVACTFILRAQVIEHERREGHRPTAEPVEPRDATEEE